MLTVVLGAGASYDCRHKDDGVSHGELQPPLAAGLFDRNSSFEAILGHYPGAESLSEEIRAGQRGNKGLEDILRDLSTRPSPEARAHYFEIALYLRELLGAISAKYIVSGSTKFTRLVRALNEWSYGNENETLFLTLNYDTLLEREIKFVHQVGINSMDDYIRRDRSWCLVKLHGSCDWGYQVSPTNQGFSNWSNWVRKNLDVLDEDREVVFLNGYQPGITVSRSGLYYPALAVPLGELKTHVCPVGHSVLARQFISECNEYLIVGMSAEDESICELLNEATRVDHLTIVNGPSEAQGLAAYKRIRDIAVQFRSLDETGRLTNAQCGFSTFIDDGGLSRILAT